jgi:hypothetical protein
VLNKTTEVTTTSKTYSISAQPDVGSEIKTVVVGDTVLPDNGALSNFITSIDKIGAEGLSPFYTATFKFSQTKTKTERFTTYE